MSVIGGGTTVRLEPGVYTVKETIVLDKQIVLSSVSGAEVTEIRRVGASVGQKFDVEQRVVRLANRQARIEGFAVSGGWLYSENNNYYGAGVLIDAAGGQVIGCAITNNLAGPKCYGIGVAVLSADGVVSNCLIAANKVAGSYSINTHGAGVYMNNGLLIDSRLTGNSLNTGSGTYTFGGGVFAEGGRVSRCIMDDNDVWGSSYGPSGGGGAALSGSAVMDNSLLFGNRVYQGFGGGLVIRGINSKPAILNCTIVDNICERKTDDVGGGVKNYSTHGEYCIQNCIIQDNWKDSAAPAANDYSGTSDYVYYTLCPTLNLGEERGNVSGKRVRFKEGTYRPANMEFGRKVGKVGDWTSYIGEGTVDLGGVSRGSSNFADIGCYVYIHPGMMIIIR